MTVDHVSQEPDNYNIMKNTDFGKYNWNAAERQESHDAPVI